MTDELRVPNDRVIFGFILGVLNFWLFALSLNGIVDKLMADTTLGTSKENIQFGIAISALCSGCFTVVAGGIGDRIGYLKITYLGFILTIVGSLLLIFASNSQMYITARILQGLSAAAIMSSSLALIKGYYPRAAKRRRVLSLWSIGSWGGSGFAALFGDVIASNWDWRTIFVLSVIVSVIGLLLIIGAPEVKIKKKNDTPFDLSGLFFFLIAVVTLNLLITNVKVWKVSTSFIDVAIIAIAVTTFFTIQIKKKKEAFIDLVLFRNKGFNGAVLSNFLLNASVGIISITPLYVRDGLGFKYYGFLTIGYAITVLSMIPVGEFILKKVGAKSPMFLGATVTGLGIVLTSLTFLPNVIYFISVTIGYIFFGAGLGLYATPSTDTALANSPRNKAGVGSGVYKMASSLGGAFGVAISLSVYYALLPAGGETTVQEVAHASMIALLVNAGFCALAAISVLFFVTNKDEDL